MLRKGTIIHIYYLTLSHISGTLWLVPRIMKWTVVEMWLRSSCQDTNIT